MFDCAYVLSLTMIQKQVVYFSSLNKRKTAYPLTALGKLRPSAKASYHTRFVASLFASLTPPSPFSSVSSLVLQLFCCPGDSILVPACRYFSLLSSMRSLVTMQEVIQSKRMNTVYTHIKLERITVKNYQALPDVWLQLTLLLIESSQSKTFIIIAKTKLFLIVLRMAAFFLM